jgi:outer membrane protein assembly factor BamA
VLNGVISEPGYGSGKQGKERVFVTTDELASHSHTYWLDTTKKGTSRDTGDWFVDAGTIGNTDGVGRSTEAAGKSVPHNTLPPSIASYGWRRTA